MGIQRYVPFGLTIENKIKLGTS